MTSHPTAALGGAMGSVLGHCVSVVTSSCLPEVGSCFRGERKISSGSSSRQMASKTVALCGTYDVAYA